VTAPLGAGGMGEVYYRPWTGCRARQGHRPSRPEAGERLHQLSQPSLAPDNGAVAFVRAGAAGNDDIYVQRVGGKNLVNVTAGSAADDVHPAFSPDDRAIAFRSERDGGGIFIMGATGESVRRLTNEGFNPA
jgi:Tol biopolymer transport system component